MSYQADMDRREFIRRASVAGGIAGMTTLAGCAEEEPEADTFEDDGDLGEPVPSFMYLNNPEDYNPARHDAINLIGEQLNEAGLDVDVEVLEWGTLFTQVTETYEFSMATWHRGLGVDPGRRVQEMFSSDRTDPGEGNFFGYENPELDPLLSEQLAVTDTDERVEILHEIQDILAEDVPMMPIVEMPAIIAFNNDQVDGFIGHGGDMGYFHDMINITVDNPDNRLIGSWSESVEVMSPVGHSNQTKYLHQLDVMYDFLTRTDQELNFDPEISIAQSLERPDSETVVAEIRDDAMFHDGEPLTAEDVAFSYNYISDETVPVYSAEGDLIENAEALDENTVEIAFTQGVGPFVTLLGTRLPIIPKHVWEDVDNPAQYRTDEEDRIGSGILEFDYWDIGSELGLVKNEDHWLADRVDFDQRVWRIIPEISTNWQLLSEGELNYLPFSRISRELDENREQPQITVETDEGDSWWFCGMNTREAGLDDKVVRQAVAHALPRTAVSEQLLYGYATAGSSVLPTGFGQFHNPDVRQYEEGIEAARNHLVENDFVFDENGRAHYPSE